MKRRLIVFLCVGVLLTATFGHVQAVGYKIEYSGSFVSILNPDGSVGGSFSPGKGVAIGDTFTGTFTFDTDDAILFIEDGTPPGLNLSQFKFEWGTVFPTLILNGTENISLTPKLGITVADNGDVTPFPLSAGAIRESGVDPVPTSIDLVGLFTDVAGFDGVTRFEIVLDTFDPTALALSSTAIPDPLVLLDNDYFLFYESINGEFQAVGFGTITSATLSPALEPFTAILPVLQMLLDDDAPFSLGFSAANVVGKSFQLTSLDYPTCVHILEFLDDGQVVGNGESGGYSIAGGKILIDDAIRGEIEISVQSTSASGTVINWVFSGGGFIVDPNWNFDFSTLNNSAEALKDWFIGNGFWPNVDLTEDGRVTSVGVAFDGAWIISDNVFYFNVPEESGCVDHKAYKLVNDELLFATDADHSERYTMIEVGN